MSFNEEKYCCVQCFAEPKIQDFIRESEFEGSCDYCGSDKVDIRNVDEVSEFIYAGVFRFYEDAANSVGYEGGYLLPTEYIDSILLYDLEIFGEKLEHPECLSEDLTQNDATPYVRKDPYGPASGGHERVDDWESFCRIVKRERRYTALLKPEAHSYGENHPLMFLEELAESVNQDFLCSLEPGSKIYRARLVGDKSTFKHEELTSPPPHLARNSRMSPAGISVFYGAFDCDTCIAEMRPNIGDFVAVAKFEVIKQLNILGLSEKIEKEELSIFDEDYDFSFEMYFKPFFSHFLHDISKPIRPFDSEIEYIPTQILTEFIRMREFRQPVYFPEDKEGDPYRIDGVAFFSSLHRNGMNIVLFEGPEISTGIREEEQNKWLYYEGYTIYEVTEINVKAKEIEKK